ncbi:hypothetical protein EcWSU1_00777 [Enterobacter ludwigii]|uniref:Uncharacterized protein n=1 Tax=Enterobacter ludwigii TaxID=299767 RepID=G8LNE6_9ENTR|nr:hypothetical protein EcWSU1_00777 [Enterobacter ludwigii]
MREYRRDGVILAQRHNFAAVVCYHNSMLVLRRQASVFGFHRPAIFHGADAVITGIDHRLDGEGHAFLQYHAAVIRIIVQNLWLFVEDTANAVAAVFTHNGETFRFNEFLDSGPNGAQANAGFNHFQRQVEAFLRHFAQTLAQNRRLAHDEHLRGVTMVVIFNDRHVDVDDVAIFEQFFVVRNTVTNHFVNRNADGFRETMVAKAGGDRVLLIDDIVVTNAVQFTRAHARLHVRLDHFQHVCGQTTGDAHLFNFFRCLNRDSHVICPSVSIFSTILV